MNVSAKDVAYVVSTSEESNVVSILNDLNYSYDVIPDSMIAATDFSQYSILFIQNDVLNTVYLPLSTKNSIFLVEDERDSHNVLQEVWSVGTILVSKTQTIFSKFEQLGTPFTIGFSSQDFQAYSSVKDVYYLKIKPSYINRVALTMGSRGAYGIVLYSDSGKRNVMFGFPVVSSWTSDTKKLFKNSLSWVRSGVEEAPVFNGNIPNQTWYEDTNLTSAFNLNDYFSDPNNETPIYGIAATSSNKNITVYIDGNGEVSFSTDPYWYGSDWISFKATDPSDSSLYAVSNIVYLNVLHVNHAPIINTPDSIIVSEEDKVIVPVNVSDIDGDKVDVSFGPWPSDKLNFTYANNSFIWQTQVGDAGNYGFNLTATDGIANTTKLINITVNHLNHAPVLENVGAVVINEDSTYSVILNASDVDGDSLNYSVSSENSSKVQCSLNGTNLTITPAYGWYGTSSCLVSVSDGKLNDSELVGVTVLYFNHAPVINNLNNITAVEGSKVNLTINATDYDGDTLSYSVLPSNFTKVDENTFEWQTSENSAGTYIIKIFVSDGTSTTIQMIRLTLKPKIVINEFVSSATLPLNEWVEIYNPGNVSANLTGCYIQDLTMHSVALSGTLASKNFLVINYNSQVLNNNGDTIKIICDGVLINQVSYGSLEGNAPVPGAGTSAGRIVDGLDTGNDSADFKIYTIPTKGLSNAADLTPPEVNLILPDNNSIFNISYVIFNYSASDNEASILNCSLYSDVLGGIFKKVSTQQIINDTMGNFWASDISNGNFRWAVNCTDGFNTVQSETRIFTINEPKAPVIKNINNITVNEGQNATVSINATDANNDSLTYSIEDSRFIQLNSNTFFWQTNYSDSGTYSFNAVVNDGIFNTTQNFNVIVTNVNEPPYFNAIEDFQILEDSGFAWYANITAYDNDGNVTDYKIVGENLSQVDCTITSNGELGFEPAANWYGSGDNAATCIIQAIDNQNGKSNQTIKINVTNVDDAPTINSYSPNYNPKITEDGTFVFSVIYSDIDSPFSSLIVNWFKDGILVGAGNNYTFVGESLNKNYLIRAVVDDGSLSAEHEWEITTSDIPLTSKYNGDTTDFTSLSQSQLSGVNLILEKAGFGRIEFLDLIDMTGVVDLDSYTEIQRGLAGIDSNVFSVFKNKNAKISFYGLNYTKTPTIYYESGFTLNPTSQSVCPDDKCTNITFNAGTLSFNVNGFSTFFLGDTQTCSQRGGNICSSNQICSGSIIEARDSDSCCSSVCTYNFKDVEKCNQKNDSLVVEIKKPSSGEKIEVSDSSIIGKIRIENNFNEDKDFNINAYLYDLTDNQEVDSYEEQLSVDSDDYDSYEFNISIPSDIEENHEYAIYAYVEDDDNSSICNSNYNTLNIERKNHDVVMSSFELPEGLSCKDSGQISLKVTNFGKVKEKNMSLSIENKELGIKQTTEEFSLDSYEGDNQVTKVFDIDIPQDAAQGKYTIKAKLVYRNEYVTENQQLTLMNCVKTELVSEESERIESKPTVEKQKVEFKLNNETSLWIISFMLLIAILTMLATIIVVIIRRNQAIEMRTRRDRRMRMLKISQK